MTDPSCDRVQQAIIEGEALSPAMAAHRDACEACRFVAALSHDLRASSSRGPSEGAPVELAPGTPLAGRYRIDAWIGRGGQGQAYRAVDLETGEVIALKLVKLRDHGAAAAETVNARRVRHPNICRVYHTERVGDLRIVVMEYIAGPTLRDRLETLSLAEAIELFQGICSAVQAAHEAGVLHLDLKPENVLLRNGREPVVTDFGLSQRIEGAVGGGGTPHYMAPEQRRAGAVDHRADVFALGRLLDALARGRSRRLARVARRACAHDPAERPASVNAVMQAIASPPALRWLRRGAVFTVGVAGLLALALLVVPPPAGRRAEWRTDLWDRDPIPADAWNVALNRDGDGLPSAETPETMWACARTPGDLLDGRVYYAMWQHGVAWRPAPGAGSHPEYACVNLAASPRCGVPEPGDRLCELSYTGGFRLLDERASELPRFSREYRERLGFAVPKVPCGERRVTVTLDRPRKVIAVRVWHRDVVPRVFRVELSGLDGKLHETSVSDNQQGRDPKYWPDGQAAYSVPVTTEITPVTTRRVTVVLDVCSTLTDAELAIYRAGKRDKPPAGGWLYEIEVFARLPRHEAWRRVLLGE
jgi:hypothetical protein